MKSHLVLGVAAVCGPVLAGTVAVKVDLADVQAEIAPNIYGLGMEDVNHEIYGGLDAQRLYGESFEEAPKPCGGGNPIGARLNVSGCWESLNAHPGELVHDTAVAHWGRASQAMKPNGASVGMGNRGLGNAGIPVRKGRALTGWLYARGSVGALEVSLRPAKGGAAYAVQALEAAPGEEWKRLEFRFVPTADDPAARFAVTAFGYGTVWIDDAYLADEPTNEFGRIGCREDVVAGLEKAGVNFLRWGGTMCNAEDYLLKNFDGTRKPYRGFWHPVSSGGFGPREFVRLAAAMKLPCAFSIGAREEVAEAVKLAEELKAYDIPIVVEIGNEELIVAGVPAACLQYCELVRKLVPPMRKANPKLKFASALWWGENRRYFDLLDGVVDYWDLHPYFNKPEEALKARGIVRRFLETIRRWNPKTTMRAAVFEENGPRHDMSRALCHALMLEEVRAAGKDVLTSCPANAFQVWKQNDNGWDQGNVFMTPDKVWLAPCAWAQRMASDGHRELLVASSCDDKDVHVSATRDRAGESPVLHFVNLSGEKKSLSLAFADGKVRRVAKAVMLSGGSLEADNGPDAPERVAPRDETAALAKSLELKPYSYTVITLGRDE